MLKVSDDPRVAPQLEIAHVPHAKAGQYPGKAGRLCETLGLAALTPPWLGLYLFTSPARLMRPVRNLRGQKVELLGSFEQVGRLHLGAGGGLTRLLTGVLERGH